MFIPPPSATPPRKVLLLIHGRADVNQTDADGNTPLRAPRRSEKRLEADGGKPMKRRERLSPGELRKNNASFVVRRHTKRGLVEALTILGAPTEI